jgi:CheY-like chemotaxis protein
MDDRVRVLAVDDSVTIRKALELILIPAGFAVEFAASGAEALDKARQLLPALLLLDFILPDLRGSEVCHELRADPRTAHIPVVLISARGAEIRQAYEDAPNVIRYLTKPFTPDEVIAVVTEVAGSVVPIPAAPDEEFHVAAGAAESTAAAEVDVLEREAVEGAAETTTPAQPMPPEQVAPFPGHGGLPVRVMGTDLSPPAVGNPGEPSPWAVGAEVEPPSVRPEAFDLPQDGPVEERAGAQTVADRAEPSGADRAEHAASTPAAPVARDALDWVFETLRAGLEGVYVEEMDTPAGAAADEAKSYTELASRLSAQLTEALEQAESGGRHALCSDGSIRSLGDTLLDSYRRVCRVLFRAAAAGAVERADAAGAGPRVLVVCHADSPIAESLDRAVRDAGDWHAFRIAADFRQLPMAARLYGPTHVLVDAARGGAVLQQLQTLRALPEGQRMAIIGVLPAETNGGGPSVDAEVLRELAPAAVVTAGPDLARKLRAHICPALAAV